MTSFKIFSRTLAFCSAALAVSAFARTSSFSFNQDVAGDDFWNALANYTSNSSELDAMAASWTNQVVANAGSNSVNLWIENNFTSAWPAPEGTGITAVNVFFNGVNVSVKSGGVLGLCYGRTSFDTSTGCGTLTVNNGGSLTVEGTGKVYSNDFFFNENYEMVTTVKDEAYFYTRGTTRIGAAANTTSQTLRIVGSKVQRAYVRNLNFAGAAGTSAANAMGGKLEFVADAGGISTLENESAVTAFSGAVSVDFTKLLWDESWGDEHVFTLLSSTSTASESLLADWVANSDTLGEIIGADGIFSNDRTNLYVTVSKIPEPSAFAALFGILAVACAVSVRRRN